MKKISKFSVILFSIPVLLFPVGNIIYAQTTDSLESIAAFEDLSAITINDDKHANGYSSASSDFQPLTKVTGTPFERIFGADATLSGFFKTLFNLSITIGALLAVLMIAWSGWQYMTTDIIKMKGDAKTRIQNALLGLLMLLATVLILRQINPDLVSLRILTNTGTAANATQQTTTPSPFTPGSLMTEPVGFCVDTVGSTAGAHASDYNRYLCYDTLPACAVNGINRCVAYSTIYNTAYSPGNGRDTGLPANTANYAARKWVSGDSSLNTCFQQGKGWVGLSADMCGAINSSVGQCCGLPKSATYAARTDIPADYWCYDTTNSANASGNPLHCSIEQSTCETELAAYTETSGPAGTCAQNKLDSAGNPILVIPPKTYSNYKYVTQVEIDTKAPGALNACLSLFKTAGYVEIPLSLCPSSANLLGSKTGKCCAIPSN
jgi:hypothetical protein